MIYRRIVLSVVVALWLTDFLLPEELSSAQQPSPPPAQPQPAPSQPTAATQPSADAPPQPSEAVAQVQQRRQAIEQRLASLDPATVPESELPKISEAFQQALAMLGKLEEQNAGVSRYEKFITDYDADLAEAKTDLANFQSEPEQFSRDAELPLLESKLQEWESKLQDYRQELKKSEDQPKNRSANLAKMPEEIVAAQQRLGDVLTKLEATEGADPANLVLSAQRVALEAERDYLQATLKRMEQQRKYYLMSSELVQIRRDLRAKRYARTEKELTALREIVSQRRVEQARQQAEEAAQAAQVERPAAIAQLAQRNAQMTQQQTDLVAKIAALDQELTELNGQIERVNQAFTQSEERIKASGVNEQIGIQLREQQELLPDTRELRRSIARYSRLQSDTLYKQYELQDRRSELIQEDMDQRVEQVLEQLSPTDRAGAEAEVRELLNAELKILDSMIENYEKYSSQLTSIITRKNQLLDETVEFSNLIKEKVLWIRSCTLPSANDMAPAWGALHWSLNPQNWRDSIKAFWSRVQRSPAISGVALLAFALLMFMQDRLRRRLRTIGQAAEKRSCTDATISWRAAGITLLLALPWPALLWFVGWWLGGANNQTEFTFALSRGMQFTAFCLLMLELVRHVCRTQGLADSHFTWPKSCVAQLRRSTRLLSWCCLPLVFWITGLELQDEQKLWSTSLGRLWFVVVMILISFVFYRLLMSRRSAVRQTLIQRAGPGRWKFSTVWMPLVAALPVALALLAVVGYYYTSQQLAIRLLEMGAVLWVLLVVGGLTRRWILLNRRRLAREQARQKRAAAIAAAEASGEQPPTNLPELPEDTVDLNALGEQTNRLIQTLLIVAGLVAVWFVWHETLPALTLISEQSLPGFELRYGQLVMFILFAVVTYVAVGNLPALLDFAVLQRLPMDAGLRYALTSISRYLLLAWGIYLCYKALGFDPTSIQWLVAAMGVGLGFGLQEIFANFVSGVILLFERPIRVGDIVTLGEKTGVVNRIRMRATTIVDWDRKEYVVPNKDLMTERLLNWTLSDQTNRIVINVGVAYGSDTDLAVKLLLEAANEHPLTLEDPAPSAIFDGFGDSTLNLVLRCFLPNLDNRLPTIHDLHTAIDKKFRHAGIEIAFPQLDVHLADVPKELRSPVG